MNKTTRLKKPQIPELDLLYTFDDLGGRPKYGGKEMTSETDIPSFQEIMDETHSAVVAEAVARDNADDELRTQIETLDGGLAGESEAREAADTELSNRITVEVAARGEAVSSLQANLAAETAARQDADANLQSEIDAIVASSDVKDIVATHAELDAYDTSTLGDNDIIKVLKDEENDGATYYYRWSASESKFNPIGAEGPYYTKSEADTLLNEKEDKLSMGSGLQRSGNVIGVNSSVAKAADVTALADRVTSAEGDIASLGDSKQDVLTAGDNITIDGTTISAHGGIKYLTTADYNYPANAPNHIVFGLLDPGIYQITERISVSVATNSAIVSVDAGSAIVLTGNSNTKVVFNDMLSAGRGYAITYVDSLGRLVWDPSVGSSRLLKAGDIVEDLTSDISSPLAASQGKALKNMIGDLADLTTEDKTNLIAAINELANSGSDIEVVQETGNSTEAVMSQSATTGMVFDQNDKNRIRIGGNDTLGVYTIKIGSNAKTGNGVGDIAIGHNAQALGGYSIAIGAPNTDNLRTLASGAGSIAIGTGASAQGSGSLAFGGYSQNSSLASGAYSVALPYSQATFQGQFDVGTGDNSTFGYNGSSYRLITGLYDPQTDHDAATKGYVDSAIAEAGGADEITNEDWSNLWQ